MDQPNDGKLKPRRRSAAEIANLVAEYRESGLTQREYARQLGVSLASVGRWVRDRKQSRAGFASVRVQPETEVDAVVTVRWPSGMEVGLPLSLGAVTVRRWLGEFLTSCSR